MFSSMHGIRGHTVSTGPPTGDMKLASIDGGGSARLPRHHMTIFLFMSNIHTVGRVSETV